MKPKLDKNLPIPLYYQLMQVLIEQIESGEMKPGDSFFSERELAEHFGISRMTVRQALQRLVDEGRIVREQGRGSFVAEPKINQRLMRLTSFSEEMQKLGKKPGAIVISAAAAEADAKLAQELQLDDARPESRRVLVLTRVRTADDRPIALETTHLPLGRFPDLANQDFTDVSLYRLLEHRYGVVAVTAKQTIEVGMPDEREMKLLQLSPGVPVLLLKRTTRDAEDRPFEYVNAVYAGDRYRFQADLVR
jgi:GntR family transcriptional regulator